MVKKIIKKFIYAGRGLLYAVNHELSFKVEIIATTVVIWWGWYSNLVAWQWTVIILVIGFVLIVELLNTVVEKLLDLLEPRLSSKVSLLKDVLAASVMLSVFMATAVGLVVFLSP